MPSTSTTTTREGLTRLDRDDLVATIRNTLAEFLHPWTSTAPVYSWDGHRWSASPAGDHRQENRPLLDDLLDAAPRHGEAASGAALPGSKIPINIDAVDALDVIEDQLTTFADQHLGGSQGLREDMHQASRRAPVLVDEDLVALADMVEGWWTAARIASGQEEEAQRPSIMCPHCEKWGTIRLRLDLELAWCGGRSGCGERWGSNEIGLLGRWWQEEGPEAMAKRQEELAERDEEEARRRAARGLVASPEEVARFGASVRIISDEEGFPSGALVLRAESDADARAAVVDVLARSWGTVLEKPFVDMMAEAVKKARAVEQVGRLVREGEGVKWRPLPSEAAGGRHVLKAWRLSWKRRPWWQEDDTKKGADDGEASQA